MPVVQVPFTGGIKQSVADEHLDASANLLTVVNGRYARDGSVEKRNGMQQIGPVHVPGDPTLGTPQRLITRRMGQELAVIDGDSLFSVSTSTGIVAQRGLIPACVATREHILGGSLEVGAQGVAYCSFSLAEGNGFRAVVYRDTTGSATSGNIPINSGNVYFSLYDLAGTILVSSYLVLSGNYLAPQVVIVGTYAYMFAGDVGTGHIDCQVLNLTTLAWTVGAHVVTDALAQYEYVFSVTPYVSGPATGILMLYGQASAGNSRPRYLRLEALPAVTVTASGYLAGATAIMSLASCRYDGTLGVVWFGYEIATGWASFTSYAACLSTAWATIAGAFAVVTAATNTMYLIGVEPCSATQCCFATRYNVQTVTTGGTVTAASVLLILSAGITAGDPVLVSRPFRVTSGGVTRVYGMISIQSSAVHSGQANFTFYLIDLRSLETAVPFRVVACLAPRQGDPQYGILAGAISDFRPIDVTGVGNPVAGTYRTIVGVSGSQEELVSTTEITSFTDLATLDFTGSGNCDYCESAMESYVSSGVPSFYDGAGVSELGFFQWPQGPATVTLAGSGGSLNSGGTNLPYTYCILYSAVDNAQQLHRSTYWSVTTGTPATNDKATLALPPLPFSNRFVGPRAPMIEVYRNTQAAQTIYYYVGSVTCPALQVGGGAYPSAVSFVDGTADATIATHSLLYTTGGLLDSVNPPSFRCILKHNERIWGIDDTGFVVWYSTNFSGSNAPYFNEALTLQFAEGPLTALAELDANLVVFSATSIWIVAGDGPNVTGQGSTLTTATSVPSDVGCANWASMVAFPGGLMFQAPDGGMYLFDRGLNVSYQKAVQNWINDDVVVVSAACSPADSLLRFVLNTGLVVTYDYVLARWAQESYPLTNEPGALSSVCCSVVSAGAWCCGSSHGGLFVEKTDLSAYQCFDLIGATRQWVPMTVTLADFKPGGLQGWAELEYMQWMAHSLDPCDVTVTMAYDGGQNPETRTFTYAALSMGTVAAPNILFARASPSAANAQSASIRVTLLDAPPTGGASTTGAGNRWLGVAFKFSTLGPMYDKLTAAVMK